MATLFIEGMQGLGDNLHQRAVVRALMRRDEIVLQTPWPWVYHDLVGPQLRLVRSASRLRTQAKNEARELDQFAAGAKAYGRRIKVWYPPHEVRARGSVLAAMLASCGLPASDDTTDFRLPVAPQWRSELVAEIKARAGGRPILVYRPLVERTEWGGCAARNPDHDAYAELFNAICAGFFVVSIADLVDRVEWQVGRSVYADMRLHRGEVEGPALAALFREAALVFASPGFAVVLAQAVGTPIVCIFGGYENASSFSLGARLTPTLSIEPIAPCNCFSHSHACRKAIDLPAAKRRLLEFRDAHLAQDSAVGA